MSTICPYCQRAFASARGVAQHQGYCRAAAVAQYRWAFQEGQANVLDLLPVPMDLDLPPISHPSLMANHPSWSPLALPRKGS